MATLKKRHIYILLLALLVAAFHLLAGQRQLMNAIAGATLKLRQTIARLCAPAPFSVAEALCTLGVAALLAWLVWLLISLLRSRGRRLLILWRLLQSSWQTR